MKIRTGFVSNSSSSSYVILIPKDFDIEDYIEELGDKEISAISEEFEVGVAEAKRIIIEVFNKAMRGRKTIYEGGDRPYYSYWLMRETLKDFVVSKIETASDQGVIKLISEDDISKIAGKYKVDPEKKKKREEKKERLKKKYAVHDPYMEENWEDENENEGLKIKKFKEL